MKKLFYSFIFAALILSLSGCITHTERTLKSPCVSFSIDQNCLDDMIPVNSNTPRQ